MTMRLALVIDSRTSCSHSASFKYIRSAPMGEFNSFVIPTAYTPLYAVKQFLLGVHVLRQIG